MWCFQKIIMVLCICSLSIAWLALRLAYFRSNGEYCEQVLTQLCSKCNQLKPLRNGNASGPKKAQVGLAYWLALGCQTSSHVYSQVYASSQNSRLNAALRFNIWSKQQNLRLLAFWVAKRRKTCVDLGANLIPTKLNAIHRKSTQVQARPGQTETQVDATLLKKVLSLGPLAPPFVQYFRADW